MGLWPAQLSLMPGPKCNGSNMFMWFANCELRSLVVVDRHGSLSGYRSTNFPGKIPRGPDVPSDFAHMDKAEDGKPGPARLLTGRVGRDGMGRAGVELGCVGTITLWRFCLSTFWSPVITAPDNGIAAANVQVTFSCAHGKTPLFLETGCCFEQGRTVLSSGNHTAGRPRLSSRNHTAVRWSLVVHATPRQQSVVDIRRADRRWGERDNGQWVTGRTGGERGSRRAE
ncbi:Phosphoglycerate mutase-like protein 1 [Nymphaea thermarum]|nr:Phosphoglycerate mutase-like protein 1 [Nymphaea thermarum]